MVATSIGPGLRVCIQDELAVHAALDKPLLRVSLSWSVSS